MNRDDITVPWQGRSWRLCVAHRTLQNGTEVDTAYIDHPGAVVIVPWQESGSHSEILMLRQYRYSLRDFILELPAGTRHQDESWETCAQRELREETGYQAGQLYNLGQFWPAPGVSNELMTIYLASGLQHNPLPSDPDEEIEVVMYKFDDLLSMALDGRLQDAKSVIGIVRTAVFQKSAPFTEDFT
jgi:ADP-ribose diphosphatase